MIGEEDVVNMRPQRGRDQGLVRSGVAQPKGTFKNLLIRPDVYFLAMPCIACRTLQGGADSDGERDLPQITASGRCITRHLFPPQGLPIFITNWIIWRNGGGVSKVQDSPLPIHHVQIADSSIPSKVGHPR